MDGDNTSQNNETQEAMHARFPNTPVQGSDEQRQTRQCQTAEQITVSNYG
ncbi:hypothetical protein [Pseudomonas sp. SJZ080]|nr:hypothetical protein [Pseudomonas sp. SJZ080]